MLDLPSISPISLFGASGISSVSLEPLTATSSATVSSLLDIARNTVEVSSGGRLLLAVALFQDELEALPGRTPDGNPLDLTATAQGFVDSFNTLLGAVDTLPAGAGALPGSALADQLVQTANELALQDIGIELQPVAIPEIAGANFRLRLDQNVLDSAFAGDAAGTEARLTGAIESLRDLTTGFVAQVAGSVISLADSGLVDTATGRQVVNGTLSLPQASSTLPADLLQQLPAATVLNGIPLSGLDLALAGVAAGDIVAAGGNVTQDVLASTLLALNNAATSAATIGTATDLVDLDLLASTAAGNIQPLAANATSDAGEAVDEAADGTEQGLPSNSLVATPLPVLAEILPATQSELEASVASLALQRLLSDPAFHVANNLTNPAYPALVAASHLSDFVSPIPVINPDNFTADVPGPVSPIAMANAIDSYNQAAGEKFTRGVG